MAVWSLVGPGIAAGFGTSPDLHALTSFTGSTVKLLPRQVNPPLVGRQKLTG